MTLPKGFTQLSQDKRPIMAAIWPDGSEHIVGVAGCTKIEAYDESGHMACIPWVAIFFGDEIKLRVAAEQVAIAYTVEPKE